MSRPRSSTTHARPFRGLDESPPSRHEMEPLLRPGPPRETKPIEDPEPPMKGTKDEEEATHLGGLKEVMFGSYLNFLLLATPVAFLSSWLGWGNPPTFMLSFFSLMPLAALLGTTTEDLALRMSDAGAALLNLTFGNFTEVVISIFALLNGLNAVVKMSLMGSVLSNMLLTFGMAILAGSWKNHETNFNPKSIGTYCVVLILTTLATVMPTAYIGIHPSRMEVVLTMSRFISVILVIAYIAYLVFQLYSHKDYFEDDGEGDEEKPVLTLPMAVLLLGVIMALISFLSDVLVSTLVPTCEALGLSKVFVGVILIPLIGNAAEMATAVLFAYHNKMGIACGVAVGSAIQVGCFVIPFLVLVSWAMDTGYPLDLNFHPFTALIVFGSVIVVNVIVVDAGTNWLEGLFLLLVYIMIAFGYVFLSLRDIEGVPPPPGPV